MSEAQCVLLVGLLYVITFNQKKRKCLNICASLYRIFL